MSKAEPVSSSRSRSWRAQARYRRPTRFTRQAARVFWTLLVLALVAVLAWLLWWWIFLPRIHVVCLPIVQHGLLAVPPIPFSAEDENDLSQVSPKGKAEVLRKLGTSGSIPTLGNRLEGIVSRRKDTLILYVSGCGVSDNGTAYLLCSDFLGPEGQGRYKVRDLLEQVHRCPAKLKLLVLDVGHVAADPRLGMLVNEFPRLLEEDVQEVQDPGLWVLNSNSVMETSHASFSRKRTVFSCLLCEGLCGAADRNGDGVVALDELLDFLRSGLQQWVQQHGQGEQTQIPRLFLGGKGVAASPVGLALLPIADRGNQEAPEEGANSAEPQAETGKTGTGQKGGAGPQEAGAPATASEEVRKLLAQAWQLRDRLQSRDASGPWTPSDYAPHLWREYQEMLLGYELRYRTWPSSRGGEIAEDLRANILPLGGILDGGTLRPEAGPSTVLARLADARARFLNSKAHAAFAGAKGDLADVRDAIQLKNDLVFAAADYVQWHGRMARDSAHRLAVTDTLISLLESQLPDLIESLESLEAAGPRGSSSPNVADAIKSLGEGTRTLEEVRQQIQERGIGSDARDVGRETVRNSKKPGLAGHVDALLATPFLPAPMRSELLTALDRIEEPLPDGAVRAAQSGQPSTGIPRWRCDRLLEQAKLEILLVRLADPAASESLGPLLKRLEESVSRPANEEMWAAYSQLGARLEAFYRDLPERIARDAGSADPAAVRSAGRLLRAVDARDAARVPGEAAAIAVPVFEPLDRPLALKITEAESEMTLTKGQWKPTTLTVHRTASTPAKVTLRLQFDASLIDVEDAAGLPISPESAVSVDFGSTLDHKFEFRVRPIGETPFDKALVIHLTSPDATASHSMQIVLPSPDVVDLVVQRVGSGQPTTARDTSRGPDVIVLRPFPNRVTSYRFGLVNRSGRARKVKVQLLGLPEGSSPGVSSALPPLDALGDPPPGYQKLCDPVQMDLPEGADPVPISFPAPEAGASGPGGAAAKPKEAEAKPAAAAAKPAAAARPGVHGGLLCAILAAEGKPERKWVKRIEFAPLPPREYLEPEVRYSASQRRITIRIRPRDVDVDGRPNLEVLPGLAPGQSIPVIWETAGELAPDTPMKDRAELTAPDFTATLFAEVDPHPTREVNVRLTVDGYPRAFTYVVKCDRDRPPIDRQRSLARIRITRPQAGEAFRAPLDRLPIEFQADAPEDAFQKPGQLIQVGIDEDGDRLLEGEPKQQFRADRQVDLWLDSLRPQGLVAFDTRVHDFQLQQDPGRLSNVKVNVLAQLILPGLRPAQGPIAAEDSVGVFLDGAPPQLRVEVDDRPRRQGDEVAVVATVEDLSGIAKVEFGFEAGSPGTLEKPIVLLQPDADGKWTARLPIKDLVVGRHVLLVRAFDKVNNASLPFRTVLTIEPPEQTKPPPPTSRIEGSVVLFGKPVAGFNVELKEAGRATKTDDAGRFVFENVPHGTYKLTATGMDHARPAEGSATVVLPPPREPAQVVITAKFK